MGNETHVVTLATLDGVHLEGDLCSPPGARSAAVICHPHPLYGGDRSSPVVDAIFRRLTSAGVAALRFDFRGAGGSEGEHGGGTDERLDVAAAIDTLAMVTDAPMWVVGYSFGAALALDVAHPRIDGWVAVAPPLAAMPGGRIAATDHRPKHLLVARHDQFSGADATTAAAAGWANTTIDVIDSADHFLAGHLAHVADTVLALVQPP